MPAMTPRMTAAIHRMMTSCFILYMIDFREDTIFRAINQKKAGIKLAEHWLLVAFYCSLNSYCNCFLCKPCKCSLLWDCKIARTDNSDERPNDNIYMVSYSLLSPLRDWRPQYSLSNVADHSNFGRCGSTATSDPNRYKPPVPAVPSGRGCFQFGSWCWGFCIRHKFVLRITNPYIHSRRIANPPELKNVLAINRGIVLRPSFLTTSSKVYAWYRLFASS